MTHSLDHHLSRAATPESRPMTAHTAEARRDAPPAGNAPPVGTRAMSGENDGAERSRRVRRKTPIDAVDERGTAPFEISSPRSLRALSHCALTNAQLQYRSLESYEGSGVPKQVAKLSFESGEDRRRQRIALVKKEYRARCRYSPGAGRSASGAACRAD